MRAFLGDQVDIFKHDDGGQQGAGQIGDRAYGDQGAAGEDQAGVAGHLAQQVTRGVRLAGAGRAVKQQAALEVLADGQQRLPVAGHSEGVPLDARQYGDGQHDVVSGDAGRPGEGEDDTAHRVQRDVEQVAAVDVEVGAQLVQFGEQALGQTDRQAGDLYLQDRLMFAGALDHHDIAAVLIGDQQQRQAQAPQSRPWPVRQVGQRRRRQPQRWQRLARDQQLQ